MSVMPHKYGIANWDTFKTECIHAVLLAQNHFAFGLNSAEELREYGTGGEYFTLSRINLMPGHKPAPVVGLKIHLSRAAKKAHPPSLSTEAILYRQLKPDPARVAHAAQDVQNAWAGCLRYVCTHGVSGYGFRLGHGLEVLFTREEASGRSEGAAAGPAPVADRLAYDDSAALAGQPDWQRVKQRSDYGRAQAIWDFCFAEDSEMDQKVARVWKMDAGLYGW